LAVFQGCSVEGCVKKIHGSDKETGSMAAECFERDLFFTVFTARDVLERCP